MMFPTGNRTIPSGNAPWTRAFTLIELILVMAMLLIVLAVSAPTLSRFFRGRTLDSEARRFIALTRYGQSRAVSEGVPMELWIDPKQRTYGLREEPASGLEDTKAAEFELGRDLSMEVTDPPANQRSAKKMHSAARNLPVIRFLPDGFFAETSPNSVVLRDERQESAVIAQSRSRLRYEIQTNGLESIR